ncbi:glycosyltransferase [Leptothoe sp. PORK10 BA2]|uniref:glycosyltransferase n=1 Tax=Leptothoe sp. PORK10 BA2 TaxID=3110254 RepID=UPI002B201D9D|nr:glycosyltransferase [Leptothoe sp. PORK10 BA2]MEA5463860.1 glycosyltransferase [Leptothoe sp. PORK10 BA2]
MNSELPLISVVIPAYNCEDSISSTLHSVFQQTYVTIEIIVINDGSTDETLTVLKRFQDSRLHIVTQSNAGVSASRNRGINMAKGDFIAFLDSDDLWLPHKLADQMIALQSKSQAAVAYSWTDYIDQDGHFLRQGYYCNFEGNVHQRLLLGSFLESGSNPLIRRTALESVGGFDESLSTCEDWDLWIRLALQYEFVVVPQVHVQYRVVTNSKSFLLDKHEAGGLSVIKKAFAQLPDSTHPLKSKAFSNFYKYLLFKLLDAPQTLPVEGQRNAQRAFRYLRLSIYYHPQLLRQVKVILSALAKILAISVQPFYRSTNA